MQLPDLKWEQSLIKVGNQFIIPIIRADIQLFPDQHNMIWICRVTGN